ncbi:MAG: sterol desaturase family protein [Myxococcaceae bacterium]|nr:sterol desaturase family protein [Myxococcaceae bacterium]
MGPNLIAFAIPFFFLLIGVEVAVAHARKRKVYRLPDALCDLGCGVGQQMGVLLYSGFLLAAYAWVFEHARLVTLPVWAQWVLAFVGVDFLYYWWHRLSHEVNLLWAAHVVHHQSEDYNLAVALRQSVTTTATSFPFYVVLAFAGVGPLPFGVAAALSTLYQFWIHTELVPPLPRFELLFNDASAHRVHHAINVRYLDKNYAATLTVWDRLFGTWEPETVEPVYGTTHAFGSFNPVWAQLAGYVGLFRTARQAPNLWQAVQVVFRKPGWCPRWMTAHRQAPQTRAEQQKYTVTPSRVSQAYAVFWFAMLAVATFSMLMWGGELSWLQVACVVAAIYFTLAGISGVLEGRAWVRVLEPVRYVGIAALGFTLVVP